MCLSPSRLVAKADWRAEQTAGYRGHKQLTLTPCIVVLSVAAARFVGESHPTNASVSF